MLGTRECANTRILQTLANALPPPTKMHGLKHKHATQANVYAYIPSWGKDTHI